MSEDIQFPYVSYKGKKYADPHAAAKAFFLDTTKTPTDRLNIHDISDTSSIDGAGVDRNGKVWVNSESFQNHPAMINLKTAMKDVFESIREVMKRDNKTLEQVAQEPLDVRPYYSYNGKRYETPQEVFKEFHNDSNKVEHVNSVMYHNRFDYGGIELAGVGPNQTTWYTQLSDYANVPAVKTGRAIFEQTKQDSQNLTNNVEIENPTVSAQKVEEKGIILDASNPIIDTKDYNLTQMNSAEFPVHFSYNNKAYLHAKDAMKAFLDTPTEERQLNGTVMLHTKYIGAGFDMAGQTGQQLWVDRLGNNDHVPEVIVARKVMGEMLNEHNLNNKPVEPIVKPVEQAAEKGIILDANNPIIDTKDYNLTQMNAAEFPVHFSYNNKAYLHAEDAMKAFLDTPKEERQLNGNVMLHTKYIGAGFDMAGQTFTHGQQLWVDSLGNNDHVPEVVAARKVMDKMLKEHNLKNQPVEPKVNPNPLTAENPIMTKKDFYAKLDSTLNISKPHFSLNDNVYLNAKDAMKDYLDMSKEDRAKSMGVILHTNDVVIGYQMAGQTLTHGQQLWVDRLGNNDHVPEVVAARKIMNEMLNEHKLNNQPVEPKVNPNPLTAENPIMTKKDFYAKIDSKGNISEPHYSLNDNVYLNAKDAMKAYLDMSKDERARSMGVMLHNKDIFGGYHMAGQTEYHGQQVWVDRLMDNDHVPEVVAARKVMNEILKEHNLKNQPVEPVAVAAPKVTKVEEDSSPRIMINAENPIVSRKDLDYGAISNSPKFPIHYTYGDKAYLHAKDAMEAFMNDPDKKPNQNGVTLHTRYTTSGFQMTGVGPNNEVWVDKLSDNDTVPSVVAARAVMNKILDDAAPKDEINFTPVGETSKQPDFPYFKYDNKVYTSASDVMKVFIADRDNNSIKSNINLHIDNHFNSVEAAGHERNGDVWRNQYSFQEHPAMQDFKKSFDKEINSYKAHLQYLDSVYADTAKVVEGYPVNVQIEDMKEMKKIIDKLPVHNVSDTDMLRIQSYKNDIKNHELSIFLDNGTKNNDVKVKHNNNLKIS